MKKTAVLGALTATGLALGALAANPAAAAAADPILTGKRQVVIKPLPSFESIVGIDGKGRLDLIDGEPAYGLFVLSPVGDKYQIKTAKAGDGPKAACIGIRNNGSNPLTAVATTCDAKRAGQLFTLVAQTAKDNGRPTYGIHNQGAFLQYFPRTGLIAEELGDANLATTFSFVDNGPAPVLPK
ncbi:hypothetical protein [Actinoplanes sp. NBRC 101535]|uniref:hypothetical protein n=1 Tax=Actinoplanes sp. NBRC 101535 TaxID=3032196 RepID=UPI002554E0A3|nr:hypothetical protein [Actinoplanes sp. NBRC 101535]